MKAWILKHLWDILLVIGAILTPMVPIIIVTGLLISFDFISGMAAALKRGEDLTSRKMSNTISKIIFYNLALFSSMGIQYLLKDMIPVTNIVVGVVAMVEAKSIYENIGFILGIDFWSAIKQYINRDQNVTKDTPKADNEV